MDFFIFTTSADKSEGDTARGVIERRLRQGSWPLNQRTFHQDQLKAGDVALLYAAGARDPDAHHVVAYVRLDGEVVEKAADTSGTPAWLRGLKPDQKEVPLGDAIWLEPTVDIRPLAKDLAFIRNAEQWGSYLQGGVRHISRDDAMKLLGNQWR